MSGTSGSNLTPLSVGQSDSGDFSACLGRPYQIGDETYVMVQCGVAIAASSQGKQLVTALSSNAPTWIVALATGLGDYTCCGAIPSTLTAAITSGAYFLALRDSACHSLSVLSLITGGTGGIAAGTLLVTGTGATLRQAITGAVSASVTGTTLDISFAVNNCGVALTAQTGDVAVATNVRYRAPFRE